MSDFSTIRDLVRKYRIVFDRHTERYKKLIHSGCCAEQLAILVRSNEPFEGRTRDQYVRERVESDILMAPYLRRMDEDFTALMKANKALGESNG